MVNPDGVDIANEGIYENNPYFNELMKQKDKGVDFKTQWKANAEGVDINRNYPADWDFSKRQEIKQGITSPAPTRFGGNSEASAPETKAMMEFSLKNNFGLSISYHTQGEEIYWLYKSKIQDRAEYYAQKFKEASGYVLAENPGEASAAGYKDWFINTFNKPGYTIEAGHGVNPLPLEQFPEIYLKNKDIMFFALL